MKSVIQMFILCAALGGCVTVPYDTYSAYGPYDSYSAWPYYSTPYPYGVAPPYYYNGPFYDPFWPGAVTFGGVWGSGYDHDHFHGGPGAPPPPPGNSAGMSGTAPVAPAAPAAPAGHLNPGHGHIIGR